MSNLQELVNIVQASRERTNAVFPLPDIHSCIDYAITEIGEYIDAVLRERRNGDKRNNDKAHSPRSEWGQCGYMIASAIIQDELPPMDTLDWEAFRSGATAYSVLIDACEIQAGTAIEYAPLVDLLDSWQCYACINGWEPKQLLRDTCAAFERKHLGE